MSKKSEENIKKIFVVPHTHWDREWYLPFQYFRYQLVDLIDDLLDILSRQDYYFMLDGQTIILEDYLEIRPERKKILIEYIQKGNIDVGPWYILPDEWLVGQESLIRNLEISLDLAIEFDIPLMNIGYLPDQFGHSKAIPQLLRDLTNISSAVIWRGVGPEITTVPFKWRSHSKAKSAINGIYMPFGYGNASTLDENDIDVLRRQVTKFVDDLEIYSPLPVYLLMNGTDHQFARPKLIQMLKEIEDQNTSIKLCLLNEFIKELDLQIEESNYTRYEYTGEFRSSVKAHLLQDTYSARMWIKQWNQKIEDLLVYYAEPLSIYSALSSGKSYPASYLKTAWKWLLKNHPHDSICGCSVDQTHEEMRSRFYWAESIAELVTEAALLEYNKNVDIETSRLLVYNPTNTSEFPIYFEFSVPIKRNVKSLLSQEGQSFPIQPINSTEEVFFEETLNPIMLKAGFNLLPGRKITEDNYINEVFMIEGSDPSVCEIRIIVGKEPIGEFSVDELKKQGKELIESKQYKKFHVKATKGTVQNYAVVAPLASFSYSEFTLLEETVDDLDSNMFEFSKNSVENDFYSLSFNKDGSFDLFDKKNVLEYKKIHKFEDWGDRGDEYTFGRLGPESVKISKVKRQLIFQGSLFCEIEQTMNMQLFEQVNEERDKRIGKVCMPVTTRFRFYRDLPRIDVKTEFINKAKDHRLRICFDLPFSSEETITSTHFGFTKRSSEPIGDDSYEEQPSGIQAQKRFIRIDNPLDEGAITLINKGLPEVELYDKKRLALTLIRSVGFLSRADYPERPMHAGPYLPTPGAQEINTKYSFEYSIMIHDKTLPIHSSFDQAELFSLNARSILTSRKKSDIKPSLIKIDNHWIKISSLRMRNEKIWVTMFNLNDKEEKTRIKTMEGITSLIHRKIDGTEVKKYNVENEITEIDFEPFEIKILEI